MFKEGLSMGKLAVSIVMGVLAAMPSFGAAQCPAGTTGTYPNCVHPHVIHPAVLRPPGPSNAPQSKIKLKNPGDYNLKPPGPTNSPQTNQ